jgi:hypothetical protein
MPTMSALRPSLRSLLDETTQADGFNLVNRVLQALSGKVVSADVPVAAKLAGWVLGTENFIPTELVGLPVAVIRAMLSKPSTTHEKQYFLASYVGDAGTNDVLKARFSQGLAALEVFRVAGIYRLGSKKEAQIPLTALLRDARVVEAARATALACNPVSAPLLAILALEGSESSIAALEPRLAATSGSDAALDRMRELEPLGRGASQVKALLARVRDGVANRSKSSGALAVLDAAGITGVTVFSLGLDLCSLEKVKPYPHMPEEPKVRVRFNIDSRDVHWYSAIVDAPPALPALWFREQGLILDAKKLPVATCAPVDLPSWLGELAKKATLTWDWDGMKVKTSLRGTRRARIEAWLRGRVAVGL